MIVCTDKDTGWRRKGERGKVKGIKRVKGAKRVKGVKEVKGTKRVKGVKIGTGNKYQYPL
jgi:hypothetical protein